jgi:hypothetical protein
MKKLFSIFFLSLLVFNWWGYYVLVYYLQESVNTNLESRLDSNNYDENQLVSIKIPVTYLPYYNNSKTYERIDGQIEIEGIKYNYVKRRIYNDSLEMLCIPNQDFMKLQSAKNEFFKFINDLQHPEQNKNANSGSSKNMTTDYEPAGEIFKMYNFRFSRSFPREYLFHIPDTDRQMLERPPKYC